MAEEVKYELNRKLIVDASGEKLCKLTEAVGDATTVEELDKTMREICEVCKLITSQWCEMTENGEMEKSECIVKTLMLVATFENLCGFAAKIRKGLKENEEAE